MRLRTESVCAACLIWALPSLGVHAAEKDAYELAFSTYVGGKSWEHARDVCTDRDGNVYVVGGTASRDFPTTPGAYDRSFHAGGKQIGPAGLCDAFVMKFSPEGKLTWSTLLGGPNYDRAYAVEVDRKGDVYVAGRAGPGFPVSQRAFQTEYGGSRYNGFYGSQNG
ncbi:MAG: SBBP repeat-containing protein, partial [Planctomycetota bacterium]